MLEMFVAGGPIMWALLAVAGVMGAVAVNAVRRLYGREAGTDAASAAAGVDAVLFWAVFAVITGVLGTTVGLGIAARAIERAGGVSPTLAWGAIRVALIPAISGLCILGLGLLLWLPLRARVRRLAGVGTRR